MGGGLTLTEGNQVHGVMTFIALLASAVGLAFPLFYGLTTLYGMEHRKMYPLLRGVDRAGRMSCLAVPAGRV